MPLRGIEERGDLPERCLPRAGGELVRLALDGLPQQGGIALVPPCGIEERGDLPKRCFPRAGGELVRLALDGFPKPLGEQRLLPVSRCPHQAREPGQWQIKDLFDKVIWPAGDIRPAPREAR